MSDHPSADRQADRPRRRLSGFENAQLIAFLVKLRPRIIRQRLSVEMITGFVNQRLPHLRATVYNVRRALVSLSLVRSMRAEFMPQAAAEPPAVATRPDAQPEAPDVAALCDPSPAALCVLLNSIANKISTAAMSLERAEHWLARFDIMAKRIEQLEAEVRALAARPISIPPTAPVPPAPPALEQHRE